MNEPKHKTKVALITTTIHDGTWLRQYEEPFNVDLSIIVAGDVKTPRSTYDVVQELGGTYIGVEDVGILDLPSEVGELAQRWRTHRAVGTNSIQRRNLALLHAISEGHDVIITVDDDNFPVDDAFINEFIQPKPPPRHLLMTSDAWFDPGTLLDPPTVARGFPLYRRHMPRHYERSYDFTAVNVEVRQGLSVGVPDVDAIEHIVNEPHAKGGIVAPETVLHPATWAPFNTQNTAYTWKVAPLMQCLVGVGRYDDIWMSYIARRIMRNHDMTISYGGPIVQQERNSHNLVQDLAAEFYGYQYTPELCDILESLALDDAGPSIIDELVQVYEALEHEAILPPTTINANRAWIDDVREAVKEGEKKR